VVEVRPELIELTAELVIQLGMGRTPCRAGKQFGSRYPGDPAQTNVFDFLPDEQLSEVENLTDFAGMLVFDKWTCNTNGRQAFFFLEPGRSRYQDPLRLDYGYRRNGTRGFVQALSLSRDPGQAKVLAFTADAIRQKLDHSEFVAITETEPRPAENPRHRFILGLLEAREIGVVPLPRLAEWSYHLRPTLLGGSNN